jgi:hypothetical protein
MPTDIKATQFIKKLKSYSSPDEVKKIRTLLRYSIEKLDKKQREHYMSL